MEIVTVTYQKESISGGFRHITRIAFKAANKSK